MRTFDVQAIEIRVPPAAAFGFISEPSNLPRWAHAFQNAGGEWARLATEQGTIDIGLRTSADDNTGTVDWELRFPDGSSGIAHSRVTPTARDTCIYSFVLHAPPVPLEELEGALDVQRLTLQRELAELKHILEAQ